jgi:hypothetical protein
VTKKKENVKFSTSFFEQAGSRDQENLSYQPWVHNFFLFLSNSRFLTGQNKNQDKTVAHELLAKLKHHA